MPRYFYKGYHGMRGSAASYDPDRPNYFRFFGVFQSSKGGPANFCRLKIDWTSFVKEGNKVFNKYQERVLYTNELGHFEPWLNEFKPRLLLF